MKARIGAFVLALAALSAQATPLKLPGFPLKAEGVIRGAVAFVDVDRDGQLELVVEHGGKVSVYSADGRLRPGSPIDFAGATKAVGPGVVGSPAVGDVDGDGKAEIAVAFSYGDMSDGSVVVMHADGTPLWIRPFTVPKGPGAGPTIADVNGDGKGDVVFGGRDGQLYALNQLAQPLPGFPVKLDGTPSSPVSFGSLVRGQKPVLAVGTSEGRLYAVLPTGQVARGFPVETRFAISGAPAFGDIDNDGEHEIVVASQDFRVYAVNADGSVVGAGLQVPYFPVSAGYRIYGGPALADLDRDGSLDIVVGAGDGKIYAWNAKGKALPGWPVSAGSRLYTSVVVGDADRDGFDEVYAASGDGNVYAFDYKGRPVDGFPLRMAGELVASPVIGNLVNDPNVELVIGTPDGTVQGYRIARVSELPMSPLSWPSPGHDASRQGHYGPNPPRYRNLTIGPEKVRAGQPLRLAYEFYDLDGDPEPATLVRWSIDGQRQADLDNRREVPGDRVKKGQQWKAVVQAPEDYALYKEGPAAQVNPSNTVKVADTAPLQPKVALTPDKPRVTDTLAVVFTQPSTDVDGDPVTYRYRWFRDGEPAGDKPTVDGREAHKGERWRVQVTPTDGELDGPAAEAEVVLLNSLPTAPEITVTPANPTTESDLAVTVAKAATDVDGDVIAYRYAFFVNGQRRALPPDRGVFPRLGTRRGDVVGIEAWAVDDEAEGPHARAQMKVLNGAPTAPRAAIAPSQPRTDDALSAGILTASRDPDGDAVSYRVQWTRDGQPFGAPGQLVVPAAETKKGEKWAVEIVPGDGELAGASARAEVTVLNSPPTRPRLAATLLAQTVDEATTLSISEASTDADGDAIRYEWSWTVDGKPAPFAKDKSTLGPGEFKKNQRWLVEVTPFDAENAKGPAGTLELRPRNSPPGAPVVLLEPKNPTVETGLKAVIATAAPDKDADALTYRYRWYRNGVVAADVGDRPQLKAGEVRHGDEWRVVAAAFDGEAEGPGAEARAVVVNVTPVAPQLAMKPAHATVVTGLTCDVAQAARDADGDALVLDYRWLRDGQPFTAPSDRATIPGDALRTGQAWKCEVVAHDGQATSPVASASATVENAAPGAPQVAISPGAPTAGDGLTCAVVAEAVDPDGDRVTYDYRWTPPAGVSLGRLEDPARVPGAFVRKGQAWKCEVTAKDGKLQASTSSLEVKVGNTSPRAARLKLVPGDATAGTELRCDFAEPASDVDGDTVSYAFAWLRNGERQPFAETSAGVPGRMVKAGDKWRCTATASDAEGPGGQGRSLEVTIGAAPASAAK